MFGRVDFVAGVFGGACLAFATIGQAHALPVYFEIDAAPGLFPTGNTNVNFNDLPLGTAGGTSGGIGVSFAPAAPTLNPESYSGGQAVIGHTGIYARPFISNSNGVPFGDNQISGQDSTIYLTTGIHSVTLTFDYDLSYLGLLWGSVDNYNTLTFYDNGLAIGAVTGTDVWASANGNQAALGTYYTNINITGGFVFDKVIASSTQYAFEFDNVSYNAPPPSGLEPIPEPSTIALLGVALLGLGALRRRRKAKA